MNGKIPIETALEAYNVLKEYCSQQDCCNDCLLVIEDGCNPDGCLMHLGCIPKGWWKLEL